VLWWVAPAVAKAAIESGVARRPLDVEEYRERLMSKTSNAAYSIMRNVVRAARNEPKRIVFPHAANPKVLRAVAQLAEEGIAHPVLLGREDELRRLSTELDLPLSASVEIVDPRRDPRAEGYAERLYTLRQRKGMTLGMARSLAEKSNHFANLMVEAGDADGLVTGLTLNYPESIRPALQILGLAPGARVAVGMYMMVLKNSVKFFGDTVFNAEPSAEELADVAVQMADAVKSLGVEPRVAMISFSNFGSVQDPRVRVVQQALELARAQRPGMEIEGEMRPEIALDADRRREHYPFARLTKNANVLVFSSLAAGNAAYQMVKTLGGASAVGPIVLGLSRPFAALPLDSTVEDVVNMTAYLVTSVERLERARRTSAPPG
jgi:malate dehydrogenase (oxaloacetate-decarboxylating)(NADP+)